MTLVRERHRHPEPAALAPARSLGQGRRASRRARPRQVARPARPPPGAQSSQRARICREQVTACASSRAAARSSSASSASSSPPRHLPCSSCPAAGRSAPPSSSPRPRVPSALQAMRALPATPASPRSRRAPGETTAFGCTAAATASSTARSIASPSPRAASTTGTRLSGPQAGRGQVSQAASRTYRLENDDDQRNAPTASLALT